MKYKKSEFNVDININEYLKDYSCLKKILAKNLINESSINEIENFFNKGVKLTKIKAKKEFSKFLSILLAEKTYEHEYQTNNHAFLCCLLKEKHGEYYNVSYTALQDKIKFNSKNLVSNQNIGAKAIFSNKLLMNKTENDLNVKDLEDNYLETIRDQTPTQIGLIIDLETKEVFLDKKIASKIYPKTKIKDYFCLQSARCEYLILEVWNIFSSYMQLETITLFDYLFFKYVYNESVGKTFLIFKNKLKDYNYIRHIFFKMYDNEDPSIIHNTNFCINEFNTIRLSHYNLKEHEEHYFTKEEIEKLKTVFISIGINNSFVLLSETFIDSNFSEKIEGFLREQWDYMCMATTIKTLLVPKRSYLVKNDYFSHQLSSEDFDRAHLLQNIYNKSNTLEEQIKKNIIEKYKI